MQVSCTFLLLINQVYQITTREDEVKTLVLSFILAPIRIPILDCTRRTTIVNTMILKTSFILHKNKFLILLKRLLRNERHTLDEMNVNTNSVRRENQVHFHNIRIYWLGKLTVKTSNDLSYSFLLS